VRSEEGPWGVLRELRLSNMVVVVVVVAKE
jgi:hypothetical protein